MTASRSGGKTWHLMPPKTILLATDLSCRTDRALDRAAALAAEWQARLVVVHALQGTASISDAPSWRSEADPRALALKQVREDLRGTQVQQLEVVVERAEPAELILKVARSFDCELIITGVAKNEALGRFLLGSTVDALVRGAEVPVLVVKNRPRGPYRSVVVTTDFSEASRRALEVALSMLPEARVSLFHAFDVTFEGLLDDKMAARESAKAAAMKEAARFLADTPAVASSSRQVAVHCEYGGIESLLQEMVQTSDTDLVVLGSAGRTGLAGLLLGSVAERLLTSSPVDALVVRQRKG